MHLHTQALKQRKRWGLEGERGGSKMHILERKKADVKVSDHTQPTLRKRKNCEDDKEVNSQQEQRERCYIGHRGI